VTQQAVANAGATRSKAKKSKFDSSDDEESSRFESEVSYKPQTKPSANSATQPATKPVKIETTTR